MIPESEHYGGGRNFTLTADLYIGRYSPRFYMLTTTTPSLVVYVPDRPEHDGRPLVIGNDSTSTQNIVVKERDGTTILTLTPGDVCKLWRAYSAGLWAGGILGVGAWYPKSAYDSEDQTTGITDPPLITTDLTERLNLYGGCTLPSYSTADDFFPACVPSDAAILYLWDDGSTVDGDNIDVSINGVLVLDDFTLPAPTAKEEVDITGLVTGFNIITITANNTGTIPPNTTAVMFDQVCAGSPNEQSLRLNISETFNWLVYKSP